MSDDGAKYSNVLVSIKDSAVALLQLNRPLKRNALSQALIDELTGILYRVDRDPEVRCIVLTGVGETFCGE